RNSFFFVRTCANSSLSADIVICLSMVLLYHFWQYRAYFSVRYCPKIFLHALQTTVNRIPDRTFTHTFLPGYPPETLAEDQMGVHSAALDLRQGVEGVPELNEQF